MFTAKISVNNRKAFEGLKNHLEYLCRLNGADIVYENDTNSEEKERKIKILYKKYLRRINHTEYTTEDSCLGGSCSYVLLWRNGVPCVGFCRKASEDEYDFRIAVMLCYSRALGWKDIEQELLDALG